MIYDAFMHHIGLSLMQLGRIEVSMNFEWIDLDISWTKTQAKTNNDDDNDDDIEATTPTPATANGREKNKWWRAYLAECNTYQ